MHPKAEEAIIVALDDPEGGLRRLAVRFDDGRVEETRLRADLVPPGVKAGDRVAVTQAALYRRWRIEVVPERS